MPPIPDISGIAGATSGMSATTASVVKTEHEVVFSYLLFSLFQLLIYLLFISQSLGNYHFPTISYNFYCKVVVARCEEGISRECNGHTYIRKNPTSILENMPLPSVQNKLCVLEI